MGGAIELEMFSHTLPHSVFCFCSLPQSSLLCDTDVSIEMLRCPNLIETLSAEFCRGYPSLSERQRHLENRRGVKVSSLTQVLSGGLSPGS